MTATEEPPIEQAAEAVKKPVVATLVGRFGGQGLQFIPLPGGARAQFDYRPGVGHVREYTDVATFHKEETAIRNLPLTMRLSIRTVLGEIGTADMVKGALGDLIGDQTMHRHVKYQLLHELLQMICAQMNDLEARGVLGRREEPKDDGEPVKELSPREMKMRERRLLLMRMGENEVRKIVQQIHRLQIPVLNNWPGMVDSVIEKEFPPEMPFDPHDVAAAVIEAHQPKSVVVVDVSNPENPKVDIAQEDAGAPAATESTEVIPDAPEDIDTLPLAKLKALAKEKGFESQSRSKLLEFLHSR